MLELEKGYFNGFMKIEKLYRKYFQETLREYQFTPNEIIVLMFLYNNAPVLDTASDIVRCKGISKGLVARSVDSLHNKGYLETQRDSRDHRVVHLKLNLNSHSIGEKIKKLQRELMEQMEQGIPEEHKKITEETLKILVENVEYMLEGEEKNETTEKS